MARFDYASIGSQLQVVLVGDASGLEDRLQAFKDLEDSLEAITGFGDFNIKEYLWHIILIDDDLGGVSSPLRQRFLKESRWGTGGVAGMRVFYPSVTKAGLHAMALDLAQALGDIGVVLVCIHALQWFLCMFQKALNPGYRRLFLSECKSAKPWPQVKQWTRLLRHPHWPVLRRSILSFGLASELETFETSPCCKPLP